MFLDVVLLAEVFTEFRMKIYNWTNLDPMCYIGTPSLAYDIFLKLSKVHIGLMTTRRQVNFIEKGIRGGFSFSSVKHIDCEQEGGTLLYIGILMKYLTDF